MLGALLFYAGLALIAVGGLSLIYPFSWLFIRTRPAALLVILTGFLLVAISAEMLGSFLVYLGLGLFLAGGVSLIWPLRSLWIRNRRSALGVAAVGLLVSLGALFWPHSETEATTRRAKLDDWMPRWQVHERHALQVTAAPDKVFSAIRAVRADEILLFRTLIAIRRCGQSGGPESILNAPAEKPLLDVATQTTFVLLEEEAPRELVVGTVIAAPRDGGVARRVTPDLFRETLPPGFVLATMNFGVPNNHGGSTVSTETRIYANSAPALRQFGVYWRLIQPGSDIIRRMWLRAIKQRAEN